MGKKLNFGIKIRPKETKNEQKCRKIGKNWYYVHFYTKKSLKNNNFIVLNNKNSRLNNNQSKKNLKKSKTPQN